MSRKVLKKTYKILVGGEMGTDDGIEDDFILLQNKIIMAINKKIKSVYTLNKELQQKIMRSILIKINNIYLISHIEYYKYSTYKTKINYDTISTNTEQNNNIMFDLFNKTIIIYYNNKDISIQNQTQIIIDKVNKFKYTIVISNNNMFTVTKIEDIEDPILKLENDIELRKKQFKVYSYYLQVLQSEFNKIVNESNKIILGGGLFKIEIKYVGKDGISDANVKQYVEQDYPNLWQLLSYNSSNWMSIDKGWSQENKIKYKEDKEDNNEIFTTTNLISYKHIYDVKIKLQNDYDHKIKDEDKKYVITITYNRPTISPIEDQNNKQFDIDINKIKSLQTELDNLNINYRLLIRRIESIINVINRTRTRKNNQIF